MSRQILPASCAVRPKIAGCGYLPKGADLLQVLKEIIRWANKHIPGTAAPPPDFLEKIEK